MMTISIKKLNAAFAFPMLIFASLALTACGHSTQTQAATTPAAAPAVPATTATLKIYNTTCHTCHGNPDSVAPQTGDSKAWAPRIAQGKDTVLDHVINGYKGMPPMGMCMQCSEDDFTALVEYMSGRKLQ